jgi:hypothetical protein
VARKKLVKEYVIELLAKLSGWMVFTYTIAKIADATRWANITARAWVRPCRTSIPATPFTATGSSSPKSSSAGWCRPSF